MLVQADRCQRELVRRSWAGLRSRTRGHEDLRCRWSVAERRVRTNGVVVPSPALDDHLCVLQRVKDFTVEQLVTELRVEAFTVAVLPWTASLDVGGLGPDGGNPPPPLPRCLTANHARQHQEEPGRPQDAARPRTARCRPAFQSSRSELYALIACKQCRINLIALWTFARH